MGITIDSESTYSKLDNETGLCMQAPEKQPLTQAGGGTKQLGKYWGKVGKTVENQLP